MDFNAIFGRKNGLSGPSSRGEYEMPQGLSSAGQKAYHVIMSVLRKHGADDGTGGSTTFYSPQEWLARGEKSATDSELVVVYDGGPVGDFFDANGYANSAHVSRLLDEMEATLKKAGFYAEAGTHWYSGIYKR